MNINELDDNVREKIYKGILYWGKIETTDNVRNLIWDRVWDKVWFGVWLRAYIILQGDN